MKRLGVSIVLPVILLSSMSSVFAADKVEDNGTTATSTSTSTSSTTESTPSYNITPTIEQSSDGKEVKVTLELKDDFKSDVNGGAIYLTYNKDSLTYKAVDKEKLIGTNDFIEYDKDNSPEGTVGVSFTSDENKDVAGKLLVVTFIKKDTVKDGDKLAFEIVETSGTNKSELLINGSTIKVKGKAEYVVGTTLASTTTSTSTPVTTTSTPVTTAAPTTTETPVVADNTGNRDGVPDVVTTEVTKGTETTAAADTKTNVTADTTKTKTGAEDYLFLSLALLLISGVLVMKNKKAV